MSEAWTEGDSETFLREADCFVPERELLVQSICRLVPDPPLKLDQGADLVVELCCGDGTLAEAVLEAHQDARVLALDASDSMLEACARRTERFGSRIEVRRFDLGAEDWRRFAEPVRAVVSTFAIHHLNDSAKRRLFVEMAEALAPGGALVIADLVKPLGEAATGLAAWQWDEAVRERSILLRGDLSGLDAFRSHRWNHHALEIPDPIDRPAPLLEQLHWFVQAGLEHVNVHWTKGGMSLFSGVKPSV